MDADLSMQAEEPEEASELLASAGISKRAGKRASCPVIAVGASAGGLEAFQNFLSTTSKDDGFCYILVQHLDPNHDSLLTQLLAKHTPLPVSAITEGAEVGPNQVMVIPPNKVLTMRDGVLHMEDFPQPRSVRRPIDIFFTSLAADQRDNCACVILSGTGSDGTQGLRSIKTGGGLTLVQDPTEAKYDGMPDSAIKTGMVDAGIKAADLVPFIRNFFQNGRSLEFDAPGESTFFEDVLHHVRMRVGHDFLRYKNATIIRRIKRRMQVVGASTEEEYLAELIGPGGEALELFRDMLINVTSFFRDPEQFDSLRRHIIPKLLEGKGAADRLRIWCPGCSSGEEPYTLAILFAEALSNRKEKPDVQIFASDIDPTVLEMARQGRYPPTVAADIPPELLDRYFRSVGDGYKVESGIRDMVRFSDHSLIKDPPFSRLDLVVCRNLLIYFETPLQERVLAMFHHSLRSGGYLFIGPSENLGVREELFDPLEDCLKIFKRRDITPRYSMLLDDRGAVHSGRQTKEFDPEEPARALFDRKRLAEIIAKRHTAPHVVVDANNRILFASPGAGRYVDLDADSVGGGTFLFDAVQDGLRLPIDALLQELGKTPGRRRRMRDVPVDHDDDAERINVSVEMLGTDEKLVVFTGVNAADFTGSDEEESDSEDHESLIGRERRIQLLEEQLHNTRQQLRATVEQLETSNEELKSSNEEMMSMNEELQSANEELSTMNDEMQIKMEELRGANGDLANYLDATQLAVIFLDSDLAVRSFTPSARRFFAFSDNDKGRPLVDLRAQVDTETVLTAAKEVLDGHEVEAQSLDTVGDERLLCRVLPYRRTDGVVDGVVLTFVDITEITAVTRKLEDTQAELQVQLDETRQLYRATPLAMGLYDREYTYLRVNEKLATVHGRTVEANIGKTVREVIPQLADMVEELIDEVFETGQPVRSEQTPMVQPGLGPTPRIMQALYYPLMDDNGVRAVGSIISDITEQRDMEREVRRVMMELQHRVKNMLANVLTLVRQASRSRYDKEEALEILGRRLRSLAATHDVLTLSDWRSSDLATIVENELTVVYGNDRITTRGPSVRLGPRATLSLGMALHEMATNAAKYGAIDDPEGTLDFSWQLMDEGDGQRIKLVWKESGPNAKNNKPADSDRKGFGTTLIDASIEGTLDGTVERHYEEDGLKYTIVIPIDRLTADIGEDDV